MYNYVLIIDKIKIMKGKFDVKNEKIGLKNF